MVDEPITNITGELRGLLADINWTEIIDHMQTSAGAIVDGDWLDAWHEAASNACDAIDAVHGNLERENESLRRELDRVLGEQEEAPTSIGSATITITPALDWSGIAADLRELAALCERTSEEDE